MQESAFQASTGSCNAAIAAWRKAGEIQHALDILPYMKLNKILPTVLTYERLLAACGDAGLWQVCWCVFATWMCVWMFVFLSVSWYLCVCVCVAVRK